MDEKKRVRLTPLQKWAAHLRACRETGRKPSLALALRAYWWDDLLLDSNRKCSETRRQLLDDYKNFVRRYKNQARRGINSICVDCAGSIWSIRACKILDCPLHPVRPLKAIKEKAGLDPFPKSLNFSSDSFKSAFNRV